MKSQPRSGSTALPWVVLLIAAVAAASICSMPFLSGQTVSVNMANKLFNQLGFATLVKPAVKVHVVPKPHVRPFWWEFSSYPFPTMDTQFSPVWSNLKALPPKPEQQCAAVEDATFEQVLHEWQAMPFSTHACTATSIQTDSCQLRQLSKAYWPLTVPGFAYATHPTSGSNVAVSKSAFLRLGVIALYTNLHATCMSHVNDLRTTADVAAKSVVSHMSADIAVPVPAFYVSGLLLVLLCWLIQLRHERKIKQLQKQHSNAMAEPGNMVMEHATELMHNVPTQAEAPVVTADLLPKQAHVQVDVAVVPGPKKPSRRPRKKAAQAPSQTEQQTPPAVHNVGQAYGLQAEVKHTPTETPAANNNGKEVCYIWAALVYVLGLLHNAHSDLPQKKKAALKFKWDTKLNEKKVEMSKYAQAWVSRYYACVQDLTATLSDQNNNIIPALKVKVKELEAAALQQATQPDKVPLAVLAEYQSQPANKVITHLTKMLKDSENTRKELEAELAAEVAKNTTKDRDAKLPPNVTTLKQVSAGHVEKASKY